jgi:regulator of cell morphogenesis and NO signaling
MELKEPANVPATIGEWVALNWKASEVFYRYGIDFCCGGKQTIQQACAGSGVDAAQLERELQQAVQNAPARATDYNAWSPSLLAGYIVQHHHRYVNEALPFLLELSEKVTDVHGAEHEELHAIRQRLISLAQGLAAHMQKEERILFPFIQKMEEAKAAGKKPADPLFGCVESPLSVMEDEHSEAGTGFHEIEQLSRQFTPPANACPTYQAFFAGLREFQQDLHQHVHLENNILFPKTRALERELADQPVPG